MASIAIHSSHAPKPMRSYSPIHGVGSPLGIENK